MPLEELQLAAGPPEDPGEDVPPLPLEVHDPGDRGRRERGPDAGHEEPRSSCPTAVVTWADVAVALPGHQATSHPSSTVATTSCPSSRTSVTPVTPDAVRPSTNV